MSNMKVGVICFGCAQSWCLLRWPPLRLVSPVLQGLLSRSLLSSPSTLSTWCGSSKGCYRETSLRKRRKFWLKSVIYMTGNLRLRYSSFSNSEFCLDFSLQKLQISEMIALISLKDHLSCMLDWSHHFPFSYSSLLSYSSGLKLEIKMILLMDYSCLGWPKPLAPSSASAWEPSYWRCQECSVNHLSFDYCYFMTVRLVLHLSLKVCIHRCPD